LAGGLPWQRAIWKRRAKGEGGEGEEEKKKNKKEKREREKGRRKKRSHFEFGGRLKWLRWVNARRKLKKFGLKIKPDQPARVSGSMSRYGPPAALRPQAAAT